MSAKCGCDPDVQGGAYYCEHHRNYLKLQEAIAAGQGLPPLETRTPSPEWGGGAEQRITDPVTGGQKGSKPSQLSMIPPRALLAIGEVYGHGAKKYDRHNWRKGYRWSLSIDALFRHLLAWLDGETTDPESGISHLAHAAWHCLALMTFQEEGLGTDDRVSRAKEDL